MSSSSEGRIHSTFFGHPVEYWTEGYVPCTGVKIPSQVDFDLAKTSLPGESDKGDKSESGLHPEGGDDRHKVIMILLRSHRPSVESGILVLPRAVTPNERSGMVPGVRLP